MHRMHWLQILVAGEIGAFHVIKGAEKIGHSLRHMFHVDIGFRARPVILVTSPRWIEFGIFRVEFGVGNCTLVAGAVVFAGGFFLFSRGVLGGGDAKLLAVMTLLIGYDDLFGFLFLMKSRGGALGLTILAETGSVCGSGALRSRRRCRRRRRPPPLWRDRPCLMGLRSQQLASSR